MSLSVSLHVLHRKNVSNRPIPISMYSIVIILFLLSTKEGTWTLKLRRAADFLTTLCFHNHFCCSLDYLIIPIGCHAHSLWTFPILQGLGCGLPNHQVFMSIHTYSFLLCCSTWRSKGFPAIHVILIKYCYFTALCLIQKVCCGCRFRHLGFDELIIS